MQYQQLRAFQLREFLHSHRRLFCWPASSPVSVFLRSWVSPSWLCQVTFEPVAVGTNHVRPGSGGHAGACSRCPILQAARLPGYVYYIPSVWFLDLHQTLLIDGTVRRARNFRREITAILFILAIAVYALVLSRGIANSERVA